MILKPADVWHVAAEVAKAKLGRREELGPGARAIGIPWTRQGFPGHCAHLEPRSRYGEEGAR